MRLDETGRPSRALYAALFEACFDGVSVARLDGRYVYVNRALCELVGYEREELLELRVHDLVPPAEELPLFPRVAAGRPGIHRVDLLCKDGALVLVEISGSQVQLQDGEVLILGIIRDLRPVEDARRALRESVQRYRGLVENLPTAVLVHSEGIIRFANPAAVRLARAESLEQLIGTPVIELASLEERANVQERIRRVIEGRTPVPFEEERLRRLDGTTFDGEVSGVPVTFEGRPASQVILRDVSERKAQERARQKLNRTLRMLGGCNQLLVRARSEPELVQGVCEIVCRAGGYRFAWVGWARDDPEKTVEPVARAGHENGYLDRVQISWADNPLGRGPTGTAIRTGLSVVNDNTRSHPRYGPWRDEAQSQEYGSSIALPLKLDGEARGALSIYAAATDAFHPEEVELLEELAADLSYGVERLRLETRHRELEAELRQAQKLNALGTLVGGIAHDFNNHLTAIAGNLFLAIGDAAGRPAVIERLHDVERSCYRSANLIKRLLTFARKADVELVRLDLRSFVQENVELLRATIPASIELRLDTPTEPVWILGEATLLQQILINLVVNARDAVQAVAAPKITVQLQVADPDPVLRKLHPNLSRRRLATLTVEDNGCGIPESDREKVFEPFFTTKPVGHGTGLGLSTVYGAVQTHRGAVRLECGPGRGTRIRIDLPLEDPPRARADDPTTSNGIGRGELLLLADDNLAAGKVTGAILRSFGFRVVYARDGEEAVALALEHRDDLQLAVLDVVMPRLDGPEAARRIREQLPLLPVVLYSGYGAAQMPGRSAAGTGPLALLGKPVSPHELGQTVRRLLDEAGVGAQEG